VLKKVYRQFKEMKLTLISANISHMRLWL